MSQISKVTEKEVPDSISEEAYLLGTQENGSGEETLYRMEWSKLKKLTRKEGSGAPDAETAADYIGQVYTDSLTGDAYICTGVDSGGLVAGEIPNEVVMVDPSYTWKKIVVVSGVEISSKADKVSGAPADTVITTDANGNNKNSGVSIDALFRVGTMANGETPGLVRKYTEDASIILDNGYIQLQPAFEAMIDARQTVCPITPTNLDYAVKSALGTYETIETFTISGDDTTVIARTVTPNNTAYAYKKLLINLKIPATTNSVIVFVNLPQGESSTCIGSTGNLNNASYNMYVTFSIDIIGGKVFMSYRNAASQKTNVLSESNSPISLGGIARSVLDGFSLSTNVYTTNPYFPAGTTVKIEGVRA